VPAVVGATARQEFITPYTPEQNGCSFEERLARYDEKIRRGKQRDDEEISITDS